MNFIERLIFTFYRINYLFIKLHSTLMARV